MDYEAYLCYEDILWISYSTTRIHTEKNMYDIKIYILKTAFNVLKLTILKYSVNPKINLNPKAGKIELPLHVVV